jgi:hypothetical protein
VQGKTKQFWGLVAALSFPLAIAGCQSSPEGKPNDVAPGTTAVPVDIAAPKILPRVDRKAPISNDDHEHHAIDDLRVKWPAPAAIDSAAFARLRVSEQQKIDRAPVPVLVPNTQGVIENLEVVVRSQFVAASGDGTGAHAGVRVFVSATKLAHRYSSHKPIERTHTVRSLPGWVLQNEGIWSANWEEHGVSYLVEVECSVPATDQRCANSDYLLKLTNELAFVGGSFGRESAGAH